MELQVMLMIEDTKFGVAVWIALDCWGLRFIAFAQHLLLAIRNCSYKDRNRMRKIVHLNCVSPIALMFWTLPVVLVPC